MTEYITRGDDQIRVRSVAAFFYVKNECDDLDDISAAMLKEYCDKAEKFITTCIYLLDELDAQEVFDKEATTTLVYAAGKEYYGTDKVSLRSWFQDLYLMLFNAKKGPRMGSFVELVGKEYFENFVITRLVNPMQWNSNNAS